MNKRRIRTKKGSVLYTVVSVMMVLIVFVMITMALSKAATDRANNAYFKKQALYTAKNILSTVQDNLLNSDEPAFQDRRVAMSKSETIDPITIGNLPANMGRIVDPMDYAENSPVVRVEYAGYDKVGSVNFVSGSNRPIYRIHVAVKYGGQVYEYSDYVYDAPKEKTLDKDGSSTTTYDGLGGFSSVSYGGGSGGGVSNGVQYYGGTLLTRASEYIDGVTTTDVYKLANGNKFFYWNDPSSNVIIKQNAEQTNNMFAYVYPGNFFYIQGSYTSTVAYSITGMVDGSVTSAAKIPAFIVKDFLITGMGNSVMKDMNVVCGTLINNGSFKMNGNLYITDDPKIAADSAKISGSYSGGTSILATATGTKFNLADWTIATLNPDVLGFPGGSFYTAGDLEIIQTGTITIPGDLVVCGNLSITNANIKINGNLIVYGNFMGATITDSAMGIYIGGTIDAGISINGKTGTAITNTIDKDAADATKNIYVTNLATIQDNVKNYESGMADILFYGGVNALKIAGTGTLDENRFPTYSGPVLYEAICDPGRSINRELYPDVTGGGSAVIEIKDNATLRKSHIGGNTKLIYVNPGKDADGNYKNIFINLIDINMSTDCNIVCNTNDGQSKITFYIPSKDDPKDVNIFGSTTGNFSLQGAVISEAYLSSVNTSTGAISMKANIPISSTPDPEWYPNVFVYMNGTGQFALKNIKLPFTAYVYAPYATVDLNNINTNVNGMTYDSQSIGSKVAVIGQLVCRQLSGATTGDTSVCYIGPPGGSTVTTTPDAHRDVYRSVATNFYINEVPNRYSTLTGIVFDPDDLSTPIEVPPVEAVVNGVTVEIPDVIWYKDIDIGGNVETIEVPEGTSDAYLKYHQVYNNHYEDGKMIYAEYYKDANNNYFAHNEWLSTFYNIPIKSDLGKEVDALAELNDKLIDPEFDVDTVIYKLPKNWNGETIYGYNYTYINSYSATESLFIITNGTDIYASPDDTFQDYHQDKNGNPVGIGRDLYCENNHIPSRFGSLGHAGCVANDCPHIYNSKFEPLTTIDKAYYKYTSGAIGRLLLDIAKLPIPNAPDDYILQSITR